MPPLGHPLRERLALDGQSRQDVAVVHEQDVNHELDDFARRKVFPGRFVRDFGKFADQLLEHVTHFETCNAFGMQIDFLEPFEYDEKQVVLVELCDLVIKFELINDLAGFF